MRASTTVAFAHLPEHQRHLPLTLDPSCAQPGANERDAAWHSAVHSVGGPSSGHHGGTRGDTQQSSGGLSDRHATQSVELGACSERNGHSGGGTSRSGCLAGCNTPVKIPLAHSAAIPTAPGTGCRTFGEPWAQSAGLTLLSVGRHEAQSIALPGRPPSPSPPMECPQGSLPDGAMDTLPDESIFQLDPRFTNSWRGSYTSSLVPEDSGPVHQHDSGPLSSVRGIDLGEHLISSS